MKAQNTQYKAGKNHTHWIYRKQNLPRLWAFLLFILVLTILPEFFIHHHANFSEQGITLDSSWGFYAWFGFTSCVAMVIGTKLLGTMLKRSDDYYDDCK